MLQFLLVVLFSLNASANDLVGKPKIKALDLDFSCSVRKVKTIDECYYLGIAELNKIKCKIDGKIESSNCGPSGTTEWTCSVPSVNCKENLNELCPLQYREETLRNKEILGNGRVSMHFFSYCVLDPVNGRKDPTLIRPNTPPLSH
jgi:hypothetical protein